MSEHTPGPWRATEVDGEGRVRIMADGPAGHLIICDVILGWGNDTDEEVRANAHLIASSPHLLNALISLADMLAITYQSREQWPPGLRDAHTAIARATGAA